MTLENPRNFIMPSPAITMDYSKTYLEPAFGLKQHVRIGLISFANNGCDEKGGLVVWHVGQDEIPDQSIQSYIEVQNLVNQCVNHGEHINAELLHINEFILGKTQDDFRQLKGKDFMTLKDDFISFIKRDPETKDLASKDLKSSLENFVTYRNIFTHGKLRMLTTGPENFVSIDCPPASLDGKTRLSILPGRITDGKWYISYIIKDTQVASIELSKNLIYNYISIYEQSMILFRKFREAKKIPPIQE